MVIIGDRCSTNAAVLSFVFADIPEAVSDTLIQTTIAADHGAIITSMNILSRAYNFSIIHEKEIDKTTFG